MDCDYRRHEAGLDADAGFDGGEFSAKAHHEALAELEPCGACPACRAAEGPGVERCCDEPQVLGGRCYNCGARAEDEDDASFWVPDCNMDALRDALAKLNKRAAKLGVALATMVTLASEPRPVRNPRTGRIIPDAVRTWYQVRVAGKAPKLNGWTFIGTIDFSDAAVQGHALRMVPGERVPARWRDPSNDPTVCDHCQASRRRNLTFIVRHDDGRHLQVGSGCLRDFLGHTSPQAVVSMLSFVREAAARYGEEPAMPTSREQWTFGLAGFLSLCATSARVDGYVSGQAAREAHEAGRLGVQSTADLVWGMLMPPFGAEHEKIQRAFMEQVNDSDRALAERALAWMPSMWEGKDEAGLSDFVRNLKAYTGNGVVSYRSKGFAAAVLGCYQREQERLARESAARLAPQRNDYAGAVGERLDLRGCKVLSRRTYDNEWGTKTLVKFAGPTGETLVWWASANVDSTVQPGAMVDLRGTVKKLGAFRGTKETTLTRCALAVL